MADPGKESAAVCAWESAAGSGSMFRGTGVGWGLLARLGSVIISASGCMLASVLADASAELLPLLTDIWNCSAGVL